MATSEARKTPRGARPNRREGLARPAEGPEYREAVRRIFPCEAVRRFEGTHPRVGRIEISSDRRPRGMIATPRMVFRVAHPERFLRRVGCSGSARRTKSCL